MQVVETELSRGGLRNHGTLALSPLQNRLPGVFPFKHHSSLRVDLLTLPTSESDLLKAYGTGYGTTSLPMRA